MKRSTTAGLALLMAIGAAPTISFAQHRDTNNPEQRRFDNTESAFLKQRAQKDVFMWRLGDYAASHAATLKVRDLGKKIAHTRQNDLRDIQQFAEEHRTNVEQPKHLTPKQQGIYNDLTRKQGMDFDKGYTKLLAAEYAQSVPQYQRMRDHAADPAVRDYAGKMLPKLQAQQRTAHDAEREVWGM